MCNDIMTIMMQRYHMNSRHKLTLTGQVGTMVYEGREEPNETHDNALYGY